MYALRQAADGIGIAQLAYYVVMDQIASGALDIILPDWTLPSGIVHAVFPSASRAVPGDPQLHRLSFSGIPSLMNRHSDPVIEE